MRTYVLGFCLLAGCFGTMDNGDDQFGQQTCSVEPTYTIDLGASVTHQAGVDPGYYVEYNGSGAWHIEWTCDTDLSSEGCSFSGSIIAPTPAGGDVDATCFECEADDQVTETVNTNGTTEIDFSTSTSTGLDGVDFTTTPGATIEINFQVNDLYQNDLVYLPSNGAAINPTCMPALLAPSAP